MVTVDNIVALIYEAFDETNAMLPSERQVEKSVETALYGPLSALDSLGLITLIVSIEQKIDERFGVGVTLAEDGDMFQSGSPLTSVEALAEHIAVLIE